MARINMKGTIGSDYSGNYIAGEIDYYDAHGDDKEIDLFINGFGGAIEDANSVMASMHMAKKPINTYNMGICASSCFQIFLSGGKLYALDYARFMCHDPHIGDGKSIDDMEEGKVKTALIEIRDQISEIISNRTGMEKSKVLKLMKAETWFDVEKMNKIFGLGITVISTKRQPTVKKNSSLLEFVNIISNFNPEIVSKETEAKNDTMANLKGILALADLNEDVANPESKIENFIKGLQNTISEKNKEAGEKDQEISNLKAEIKTFKDKEKADSVKNAESYANQLIEQGLIKEDGKQDVIDLYILDPEKVQNLYGKHNLNKLTNIIDPTKPGRDGGAVSKLETFKNEAGETVVKNMDWYGDNEPELLDQWEKEAREGKNTDGAKKFKALFLDDTGEDFDAANKEVSTSKHD